MTKSLGTFHFIFKQNTKKKLPSIKLKVPKKTINSTIKLFIPSNAREVIDKILKVVNIFGIGIAIPR